MKIGIYGGSFSPVHFGHVGLAKWVIGHTDLDEVWLLISPNNPLKPAGILAPEEERLAAVQEAIKDIPHLVASDFEFQLPRPSYTANTLRELRKAFPEHEFSLIIGEDNIAIFDRWREWRYIASNFRIFVYPRKGSMTPEKVGWKINDFRELVFLNDAPLYNISSTELRRQGNCCRR